MARSFFSSASTESSVRAALQMKTGPQAVQYAVMGTLHELTAHLGRAVHRERLLDTAAQLVAVPSPTGRAGGALDRLTELLSSDGFIVERVAAGHELAPAVVVRLKGVRPGPTLQFNG